VTTRRIDRKTQVIAKRDHGRVVRKAQVAGLVVAVVTVTIGGTFALTKVFHVGERRTPEP
jgi:hypothetical protein